MTNATTVEQKYLKKVPELRSGDVVRVHQKIKEGNKERVQVFEGVILRTKGGAGLKATFLVRKISFGVGVEKNFLLHSPNIAKIEVKKRAKVRQAYLGYLRNLSGKSARLKDKQFDVLAVNVKDEEPFEETPAEDKKAADVDAAVTELNEEEMQDPTPADEVPLSEVEKAEEKQAEAEATEGETSQDLVDDNQQAQTEEIAEGLDKAEGDLASGKEREGARAEKTKEEGTDTKDLKDEVEQEKESEVG